MKFLQKLGKALMLPVAVLPICGILILESLPVSSDLHAITNSRAPSFLTGCHSSAASAA